MSKFIPNQPVRSVVTKFPYTIISRQEDTLDGQEVYTVKGSTGPNTEIYFPTLADDMEAIDA